LWGRFQWAASRRRCSSLSDCQTSVPMDYCIDTVNSLIGSCHWWPSCVWIIIDGHVAIFKSGIPLKCLGTTQHCFSKCLLYHFVLAVLPSFWQNLMQTRCSFNTSIS
jgi:hypothetical protein